MRFSLHTLAAACLFAIYSEVALADVVFEQDFTSQANCTTGRENQCWIDNGFLTGQNNEFPRGTVEDGYFEIKLPHGGSSTGRITIPLAGDLKEARIMRVVEFAPEYIFPPETHGPAVRITGDSGCDLGGNLEMGDNNYFYHFNNGNCGFSGSTIMRNQSGSARLRGGRKYVIEEYIKIDDSCSDSSSPTGCNGIYRLWVDGVLWSEHTNRNFGGVNNDTTISVWAYEWYMHIGNAGNWGDPEDAAPWARIHHVTIRDDNTEIGAPDGLVQGTQVDEPYFAYHNTNNFRGNQFGDCTFNNGGRRGFNFGSNYLTSENTTLETTSPSRTSEFPPDPTECSTEAAQDGRYMRSSASSGGTGIQFGRRAYADGAGGVEYYQNWFIHGWLYLPEGNNYGSVNFAGFRSYNCFDGCDDADYARTISLSVNDGKWAIARRWDTLTQAYHTAEENIITGEWVEFELWHDRVNERASLRINGERVVDADLEGVNQNIMQDPGGDGGGSAVVGIIYTANAVTINYSDVSIGTQSFSSCDGWEDGVCPYENGDDPDPPPPIDPPATGNGAGGFVGVFF
jgi:hypothetical protein